MKLIAIVLLGILVISLFVGFYYFDKRDSSLDFFEENNIEDDTPIGKDLEGNWLYQTRDNQIIKSKIVYPTERGLQYQRLVEG